MKEKIDAAKKSGIDIIKHPLFGGSAVMIFGSNFANFFAYLYHLVLGRMLGPSAYSELAVALAAIGLFSTTFVFFGLVVVKFAASSKKNEKILLFKWLMKISKYFGVAGLIILIFLSPFVSSFLKIPLKIALIIPPTLFLFLFSFLFRSFLQGLLKFGKSVSLIIVDISSRLVFGALFVFLGFSSLGGVLGITTGGILSLLLGYYYLRKYFSEKKAKEFSKGRQVLNYSTPIVIASIANNSFISSDVMLAKHYFDPHLAGIYASLSILGKIIFYGTAPIASVMFPIISKKYSQGQKYQKVLFLSTLMTALLAGFILIIYYLAPEIMIKILFGNKFLEASSYLVWFGIFMTFYTLANLFVSFYLSIENTKIVILPLFFALVQIVGILVFHETILSVIHVSTLASALLFLSLIIYFWYEKRKE